MKRAGNLFYPTVALSNLWLAAHKAWRGKKDKPRIAAFYFNVEEELLRLQQELITKNYTPQPFRTFMVFEPKRREIAAADFRDRVVHHAICNILEPHFENTLIHDTYACRVGKGTHVAVARAQHFSRRFPYFLKCDIRKYFASMDHNILKHLLARHIKDRRMLALLEVIIDHAPPNSTSGKGVPIGNLTSQHFANLYLGELDHFLKDHLGVRGYVRYMDDFLIFDWSKKRLHILHTKIQAFLLDRLALTLKERATVLAPVSEGVPFLGFRIFPRMIRLQQGGATRFRRKYRQSVRAWQQGKIDDALLVTSVASMIGHVAHADTWRLRKSLFSDAMSLG